MKNAIKALNVFDFDGTLFQTFEPQVGKSIWEKYYNKQYPYHGWWGRPESLDLNVFNIKPFPSVLNQLNSANATPNTYVIILTSRVEKLRLYVQAVLDKNNIIVNKLDMKHAKGDKGVKLLRYIDQFPELEVINVYDDRESDILAYKNVRNRISNRIEFNIYQVDQGKFALIECKKNWNIVNIIFNEIRKFVCNEVVK
jgi:hypothetical protein